MSSLVCHCTENWADYSDNNPTWKSSCGDNTPQGELQLSASSFASFLPSPLLMSALHPLPSVAATGGFYYGSPIVHATAPYMYSDVQHTGMDPLAWAKNTWHGFEEPKALPGRG
jgi:hypothetical protein